MARTFLIHLNVQTSDNPNIGPDEVADMLLTALEVGSDDDTFRAMFGDAPFGEGGLASGQDAPIAVALAEEV